MMKYLVIKKKEKFKGFKLKKDLVCGAFPEEDGTVEIVIFRLRETIYCTKEAYESGYIEPVKAELESLYMVIVQEKDSNLTNDAIELKKNFKKIIKRQYFKELMNFLKRG